MKIILSSIICLGLFVQGIAQTINLKTNGYNLNFKKIDTLFYAEYSISSAMRVNAKSNEGDNVNLKYSFGKISKTKANLLKSTPSFTTNYYAYQDGTLQAPTTQLFFKPINIVSFKKDYSTIGIIEEHPSLKGYYYLYVTDKKYNTGESIFELCNKIYNDNSVKTIEPVFEMQLKLQNPLRPWEWNIRNNGNVAGGVIGADMRVEKAWCNSTGIGINVAVIDDGVDLTHPDLQANLLPGFDATGNNSGGAPVASNGHGTNCAGIIASVNNAIGTIGVAFNSRIIPIRMGIVDPITGGFNTNTTWQVDCFAEAVNRGADVISCSWGGGSPTAQLDAAITAAVNNGRNGRGCVVLFSTGNRNTAVGYPATNTNVIAVGASTPCDTRKRSSSDPLQVNPGVNTDAEGTSCDGEGWWGSNFGTGLDVLAPGVWISTTDNVGAGGFNLFGDYNDHFNGTSAACPNTAAVVALILAANPNLTGIQARNILEQTCFKIPNGNFQINVAGQPNGTWSNQAGYGRVDADRAVRMVLGLPETIITGNSFICLPLTSSTYTINNLPACGNNAVTWTTNIPQVTVSPQIGATTTLSTNGYSGAVTLTATINGTPYIRQLQTGGTPTIGGLYTNAFDGSVNPIGYYPGITNPACTGYYITTNIDPGGSASWQKISSTNVVNWAQNGNNIQFYLFGAGQSVIFQLTYTTNCGSITKQFKWQSSNCSTGGGGGGCNAFTISPNPSTGVVNIIVPNIPPPCFSSITNKSDKPISTDLKIVRINVYNLMGNIVKQIKTNISKQPFVDLSSLTNGSYYIEIISINGHIEKQLVFLQK